jgi:hypothetical protein
MQLWVLNLFVTLDMASTPGIEVIPASTFASFSAEARGTGSLSCRFICRADSLGHLTGDWRVSICSDSKIVTSFMGTQLFNAVQLSEYGFTQETLAKDISFPVNNTVTPWKDADVQVAEHSLAVSGGREGDGAASFLRLLKETYESTHQAGACTREVGHF